VQYAQPICAILILLLGAFFPKTVEGTIVGAPCNSIPPAVSVKEFFKKLLLPFFVLDDIF